MKLKVIFPLVLIFFLFFGVSFALGQNVDVIGTVKISEMEIDNTIDNLVVQKADGTLVRRLISSVPPPPELSDTSRTFANDLEFAKLLCNCSTIPPFLVESALYAGYTGRQLYDGGVDAGSLFKGGVSIDSLIAYGETVQSLLTNNSATPIDLYNGGVTGLEMYGASYEGGLIFFVDTLDVYPEFEGMVSADIDQSEAAPWGCSTIEIPGADDSGIGYGRQNTIDIVTECLTQGIAARLCDDLGLAGYNDWFLPSKDETFLMYENLQLLGFGGFSPVWYFSSTEISEFAATVRHFSTGSSGSAGKSSNFSVRAVRTF